ncbi:hypothetical protein [Deinococcus sp. 6GRE01]|uniref:hypothetical protein n=1 Tax=Deinococcus sp. 6GRE01 TaxID=2745873 RepID=UPI001E6194D6|nr:hypothetical protein [Deinococcus sp. 6GRE01]MCD0156954.1 hypothetical protein [Deinococcus sp. 6GRE01]
MTRSTFLKDNRADIAKPDMTREIIFSRDAIKSADTIDIKNIISSIKIILGLMKDLFLKRATVDKKAISIDNS